MTELNAPYSTPAAEAVDNHLSSSIDALRSTTEAGFSRVDSTMKELVTRGEFNATVQRLDAKDEHLESRMTMVNDQLSRRIDTGLEGLTTNVNSQFTEMRSEEDKRTTKTRWLLGTLVVAAGLAWQVISRFIP